MDDLEGMPREKLIELIRVFAALREEYHAREAALKEQLTALIEENAALREGKDGPGSGDPPKKNVPGWVKANKPLRAKSKRKKRDRAYVRPVNDQPDDHVDHVVDNCPNCGRKLAGGTIHHTREIIDIPQVTVCTVQHRYFSRWCGVCKKRVLASGGISNEACGKGRIGPEIMSLIGYLRTMGNMPIDVIRELLKAQYGLEISVGEISRILKRIAEKAAPIVEKLLEEVRAAPFVHADETGWRENGKNGYIWSFSTPTARYYLRAGSRGSVIPAEALGDTFKGILVTDFYGAYNFYLGEHQRCWVHFLRDLHELKQKHPDDESVAAFEKNVRKIFDHAKAFAHDDVHVRRKRRTAYQEELYNIAKPYLNSETPQRVLAQRIERFANELFVFVEYPGTPSDNNAAERAVRPAVTARKISGGTRSEEGSATMSTTRSLYHTWKLRGQNAFENGRRLLRGALHLDKTPA